MYKLERVGLPIVTKVFGLRFKMHGFENNIANFV